MEYYKVGLYKFYQQNEGTSIDLVDTIIVGKGLSLPTKEEIKNDTFRVKEIMTNLVIKCLPSSYCFEEGNINTNKLKKGYISQTDLTKYDFQLFLLDKDFKEDNMATAEEVDGYIEKFETSKFKNHYDKIKDKKKKIDKKERKKVKQKVKKIRGKYE